VTDEAVSTSDVVVVGAGFSGLYLIHRLRNAGLTVRVFDAADDVGGTWYWNRYPGARCDIPTTDYSYSFDPSLDSEWSWSEKYATQPEILAYLGFVADRYDLRRDITFSTRVIAAVWDEGQSRWLVTTDGGERVSCRFFVMASGCLSVPKIPDIPGVQTFAGEVYYTNRWPHDGVDFTGKRVAVIGTGSSGIQSIPLIATQADQLTVFQRTANFAVPAHNGPVRPERLEALLADRDAYREAARHSRGGVPIPPTEAMALSLSEEERRERFEEAWEAGELFSILNVFADQLVNPVANEILSEMVREKIRSLVEDPQVAEDLCPNDHPIGSKRTCLETDYYTTFNRPNVRLVNLRRQPIHSITPTGIDFDGDSLDFDAIVFATGFDAMTGALVSVDMSGRDGLTLREKWADGPSTYLGLMTRGFPNCFAITGPGSPSVLSNMVVSIEQHVDWTVDCIKWMLDAGFDTVEATATAEAGWDRHVADCAEITLMPQANSWYMGANVPGKPRVFYPYIGGVDAYRDACDEVAARGYLGLEFHGPSGAQCNDGVIREMQPDVAMVLTMMAAMELPPIETLGAAGAREFLKASSEGRPPGPECGSVEDSVMPGPGGDLPCRVYKPSGPGPFPAVVYFHGGGWVIGDLDSDDPLCRDLCVRSGAMIVSVNYRHAPEAPFPAPVEDAFAALRWVADNAESLEAVPGQLAVAGWSAGGNLAAVVCQLARDAGGPAVAGQLLFCPATDVDMSRGSYRDNADGYVLTASLMKWFFEQYLPDGVPAADPRLAPLRGNLAGLPPAAIVTADFDPLRDEGDAYAQALFDAGVPVTRIRARGHTHTSVGMVDMVISAGPVREEMAAALRSFFPSLVGSTA
jgi:cation diffusion facilitator CzcD-associated flavoprotein CzcO/acetyl esterase/lipase